MIRYLLPLLFISCAVAKTSSLNDEARLANNLKAHVQFLADDRLQGRRTGTEGERLAAEYISKQFQQSGLTPKGTSDFFQPFEVNEGRQIGAATHLTIEGKALQVGKDFFPLPYSGSGSVEALPSIALQERGMPWFLDVNDLLQENKNNPHFDLNNAVLNRAKSAEQKGAVALFIYNTSKTADAIKIDSRDGTPALKIPVIYITQDAAKKFLSDESAMVDVKLKTEMTDKKRTGKNVVGFIDNGAAKTVVLGAHYDHLGFGEDHNSRHTGTDKQIHNGADDNASGVAALIELARLLKNSGVKNHNYLFVAFSGEELGLHGSKYFAEHAPVALSTINYMINMDMVGRLNDSSRVVTVGGYGTSPVWGKIYGEERNKIYVDRLQFRFDSSGTGPSDHTSFYLKNIPVLFYFTGLHEDYHKPSDDFDKINYSGQAELVKHIFSVVQKLDAENSKLAFTKTREAQTTTTARFSVSLGIMPDYTYSGVGVRVDGVSAGRAAEKAGIKTGDIVIAIGDYNISSMESYMQALSKFRKGDKTVVKYKRGAQTLSSSVEF